MRKITLGRFPEMGVEKARSEAAARADRPVARYLDHAELERLGTVLDRHMQEHPWPVAAIRLPDADRERSSPKSSTSSGTRSESLARTARARGSAIPRRGRARSGSDRKRQGSSRRCPGPRGENGYSPRNSHRTASTISGSASGTRRAARAAHPRLPPHLGLAGRDERRRAHHGRAAGVIARAMGYRAEPPPEEADESGDWTRPDRAPEDSARRREVDWLGDASFRSNPDAATAAHAPEPRGSQDPDWNRIEAFAEARGLSPSEFVRNTALAALADGHGGPDARLVPLIETTFLATHILVSRLRKQMLGAGEQDELDAMIAAARALQAKALSRC